MKNAYNFFLILSVIFLSFQGIQPVFSATYHSYDSYSGKRFQASGLGGDSTFIYDDGTAETGWGINPGNAYWIGNYFPVESTMSGYLKSFDVYFINNPGGSNQQVSIDVFNSKYGLIGSSALFMQSVGTWIPVTVNSIPFAGPFYVMIKWNNVPTTAPYLGLDINGPNAAKDLERYYNGTNFFKLSDPGVAGSLPGVFLIRAHAFTAPLSVIEEALRFEPMTVCLNFNRNFIEITAEKPIIGLKILDLIGRIRIDKQDINSRQFRIDLSAIPEGMYLLYMNMRGGNFVRKIMVH
jgi:hypothetical protein